MNTFGIGVLLWTVNCTYSWITHSGIWRIVMEVMRPMQKAVPDGRSVAIIAYGFRCRVRTWSYDQPGIARARYALATGCGPDELAVCGRPLSLDVRRA